MDSQAAVLFGLQSPTTAQAVLRKYYKDAQELPHAIFNQLKWSEALLVLESTLFCIHLWAIPYRNLSTQEVQNHRLHVTEVSFCLRNSAINICWDGFGFRWDLWRSYWLNHSFSSVYHLHTQYTNKYITELNSMSNHRSFCLQKHLKTLSTDIHIYMFALFNWHCFPNSFKSPVISSQLSIIFPTYLLSYLAINPPTHRENKCSWGMVDLKKNAEKLSAFSNGSQAHSFAGLHSLTSCRK